MERVTFWYGCNVLRHGDIIHACLDILRAVGFEPSPVGGPDYCCGTVKDANQVTAGGMATRTVGKLNDRGAPVVVWCPSCHSHMHEFMGRTNERRFDMSYLCTSGAVRAASASTSRARSSTPGVRRSERTGPRRRANAAQHAGVACR